MKSIMYPPPPVKVSTSEAPKGPDFGEIEMYVNASMMRMPTNYVDMNADEIEYSGGWFWSAALSVVGWTCTIFGHKTNNDALKGAGTLFMATGMISTGVGIVTGYRALKTGLDVTEKIAARYAYNSSMGVADSVVGVGSYNYW